MKSYIDFVVLVAEEFEQTMIKFYYKKYRKGLNWVDWLTIPKKDVVLQLLEQEAENQEIVESQVLFCFNYWKARVAGLTRIKSGNTVLELNEYSDSLYIRTVNDILCLLLMEEDVEVDVTLTNIE
jgi:hypothetical protein